MKAALPSRGPAALGERLRARKQRRLDDQHRHSRRRAFGARFVRRPDDQTRAGRYRDRSLFRLWRTFPRAANRRPPSKNLLAPGDRARTLGVRIRGSESARGGMEAARRPSAVVHDAARVERGALLLRSWPEERGGPRRGPDEQGLGGDGIPFPFGGRRATRGSVRRHAPVSLRGTPRAAGRDGADPSHRFFLAGDVHRIVDRVAGAPRGVGNTVRVGLPEWN